MKTHIPLGVGFYPDWWNKHYGISYDKNYYFDPETRIAARMEMDRRLHERFGDVGLGDPDPKPKPLITFGMVMLPAVFGCEIVFKKDALPWALPLNLSEEQIMKLEVPDLTHAYPLTEVLKQIEYLIGKYGRVVGDINTTGVQNLALKLRGEQLYFDYFERPALCHHLLRVCTLSMIALFKRIYPVTGTGAVDVTPMCDPRLFVLPNCTVEQISLATYEEFNLPYDNQVAQACHPLGIHHCGSVNQVLDGYAQVRHLKFLEVGFGSDVRRTREVLGPKVAVNARINPVLMKNGTPEEVSREVRRLIDEGAPLNNFSIDTVGLTFGTPDENVKAARRTAAEYGIIKKRDGQKKKDLVHGSFKRKVIETRVQSSTQTVLIGSQRPLVIIGERINPTGRKKLAAALEAHDLKMVQEEALAQVRDGAHILDVNVGVSGIDEPRVLAAAVRAIQEVTDAPLCLDSALPQALEAGLEVYRGKALVNSVNGEKEKLDRILPLVKRFGAAVIGLTMDDRGIPRKAEDRLAIAEKIVLQAEKAGIPREDVIIDPLAMALSADHLAALETLKALRLIRKELGVNLTLGLSNISFGLPDRTAINAAFLNMAVWCGLTCAIIDPTVREMRRAAYLGDLLLGMDENCLRYIAETGRKDTGEAGGAAEPTSDASPATDLERLMAAVIDGKRREAEELTRRALAGGTDPQAIIQGTLIPALNVVGERFEKRKIFVPEMMVSAKAMQACVDLVKPHLLPAAEKAPSATIVLGTVFGDLHDIGKNLVKLLLESAGLRVIDLGENVPVDRFVAAAREQGARVIGLSSLLTTGDPFVEQTVKALKTALGDTVQVICGGAALTPKFVLETCGADAHAKDAADGLKQIKKMVGV